MSEDNKRNTRSQKNRSEEEENETKEDVVELVKVVESKAAADLNSCSSNSSSSGPSLQYRELSESDQEENENKGENISHIIEDKVVEFDDENNEESVDDDDENDGDYHPPEEDSIEEEHSENDNSVPRTVEFGLDNERKDSLSEEIDMDVDEKNVFEVNIRNGRNSKPDVPGKPKYCSLTDSLVVLKMDHMAQCFYCKKVALASTIISHLYSCYYGTQEETKRKNKISKQRQKAREDLNNKKKRERT